MAVTDKRNSIIESLILPTPDKLYHYSTIESMFSILKNHTLWLSSSFTTNDYFEKSWFNKILVDVLRDFKKKIMI